MRRCAILGGQPLSAFVMASAAGASATDKRAAQRRRRSASGGVVALRHAGAGQAELWGATNYLSKFTAADGDLFPSRLIGAGAAPIANGCTKSTSTAARGSQRYASRRWRADCGFAECFPKQKYRVR